MLGLIHQFKYQGALWMTPFFKQLMECRWEHDHEVMACEGILPVTLHPLRKGKGAIIKLPFWPGWFPMGIVISGWMVC